MRPRRSDPARSGATPLRAMGLLSMFDLPKYGDGICLARLAELLDVLGDRSRRGCSASPSWSPARTARARPRRSAPASAAPMACAPGCSPRRICIASTNAFRSTACRSTTTTLARLMARIAARDRRGGAATRRTVRRVRGAVRAGLPVFSGERHATSRCSRPASAAATIRCGWSARASPASPRSIYEHVALLGNSLELIASDKSDACAAGGTIVYGENCRPLRDASRRIQSQPQRRRRCSSATRSASTTKSSSTQAQHFDLRIGGHDYRCARNSAARRVPVQQRRDRRHAVPALAASSAQPEARPGRDRRRDPQPACATRAGPAGSKSIRQRSAHRDRCRPHARRHPRRRWPACKAIHGARRLDAGARRLARQEGRRDRRRAGAVVRHHHLHARRITRARTPSGSPKPRGAPIRSADIHVAATIEDAVRNSTALADAADRRRSMSPADCSSRSNIAIVARGGRAEELKFF